MCKPAKQRGHLQIFRRKFCMMLQLVARQTHCAFLLHRLQVTFLYTLTHKHANLLMVISQHLVVVQCSLSASSVNVWQLHINILHYSMLVSHVMRVSAVWDLGRRCHQELVCILTNFLSIVVSFVSSVCYLARVASFLCTQCDIIMSRAASAYVPAGKHHFQNPCIDVSDGARMTTAFADDPLQKLVSNIGNFGTFGLIHIAGPSTQVSILHHCCRGANSCCSAAWQSNKFNGIIIQSCQINSVCLYP